ncbi:MAG: hypothetical protein OEO23_14240 [Gemmatimonadota bacterium]|nr:hypothetical protein [Gemmatimonadota bacterium]
MSGGQGDFYVGYVEKAPSALGRWLRAVATATLTGAVLIGLFIGIGQRQLPEAAFDYGVRTAWSGYLVSDPFPALLTRDNGGQVARVHLVAAGKHGADEAVTPYLGQWVTLTGTLIHRGSQRMLELEPASITADLSQPPPPPMEPVQDLGVHDVEGEVVGSKCFLGVMNPGSGTAHRACARLCLLGGVPPMLAVTKPDGSVEGWVLAGPDGGDPQDVWLDFAAEAVAVTGRVVRVGSTTFLHADPLNIRRLD